MSPCRLYKTMSTLNRFDYFLMERRPISLPRPTVHVGKFSKRPATNRLRNHRSVRPKPMIGRESRVDSQQLQCLPVWSPESDFSRDWRRHAGLFQQATCSTRSRRRRWRKASSWRRPARRSPVRSRSRRRRRANGNCGSWKTGRNSEKRQRCSPPASRVVRGYCFVLKCCFGILFIAISND